MSKINTKTFFIAEAGVNHNGCFDTAINLIRVAAAAGADAVKFQTFKSDALASVTAPKVKYQVETTPQEESQLEMLKSLELPENWHRPLIHECEGNGIEFMTTAFDKASLAFVSQLPVDRLKVPSGELVNGPLLWEFAKVGKPLILSTGMATLSEIELALAIIAHAKYKKEKPTGISEIWDFWIESGSGQIQSTDVTLLHCTSQYPAPEEQLNLRALKVLKKAFGLPVGYSDHSVGCAAALASVALGACVIEKHFTLDKNMAGPDHKASIEPHELKELISNIRFVEKALGDGFKRPQSCESEIRELARQKLFINENIAKGQVFEEKHLTSKRSAGGVLAMHYWDVLGSRAEQDFSFDEPFESLRWLPKN